ncbi:hypothetical protein [Lolliginicoccus suaedae]|uniref:hypothetical protein n=1 Tax=Lolliginicoccus suaedae TaxID=2605429 RepID=UPI0011ED11DF|nr:hypothetical protein [Lolliginicoccus suaedae]
MTTPDATPSSSSSDLLVDAFARYMIEQLTGERFVELVHKEVDHALEAAEMLTLGEVMTAEQVAGVALKYASEWRIEGAIPELSGEIARRVHARTLLASEAPISDVVDDEHFAGLAEKVTSLPAFRRLLEEIVSSPVTARWISLFLYRSAAGKLHRQHESARALPGLGTLLDVTERITSRIAPRAGHSLEIAVRELAERTTQRLISRTHVDGVLSDNEPLVEAILELWDEHSSDPVGSVIAAVDPDDIEDFLILGFEFWRDFRQTTHFRSIVSEGVAYFFEKYSAVTLAELLDEVGVSRDDMIEEALRFAPPILELTAANGMLTSIVQRLFGPFAHSDEVQALLLDGPRS